MDCCEKRDTPTPTHETSRRCSHKELPSQWLFTDTSSRAPDYGQYKYWGTTEETRNVSELKLEKLAANLEN